MIRTLIAYLFVLVLASIPPVNIGQKRLLNAMEIDQKFSQVWKESEASRKNYSWKSRIEVTRDDKVVQVLIEEISVDPDEKQIRKVVSNHEAPLPSNFIIRQIAEDQKSKLVAFMNDLRNFLEKYALTDDNARHDFFSKATITTPDARGLLLVSGSDVLIKGDKLKWWIDTRHYTVSYATISTTYKGVNVDFSATYYLLPGLNYMSQAQIRVPSKNISVSLKFYDFMKR
jgi:hypothetical protein